MEATKQNPLLSIIIPSYNQVSFLPKTLSSILSQDYPHFEVIIVDGCSIDGTLGYLESVADCRVRWVSEQDRGQSHAINKGLEMAIGTIIGWQNADDLYGVGTFRTVISHFVQCPSMCTFHGVTNIFSEDETILVINKSGQPFCPYLYCRDMHVMNQALFFTRDLFVRGLRVREDLKYTMDKMLVWDLYRMNSRFVFSSSIVGYFRRHDSQITGSHKSKAFVEELRVLAELSTSRDIPHELHCEMRKHLRRSIGRSFRTAKSSIPSILFSRIWLAAFGLI